MKIKQLTGPKGNDSQKLVIDTDKMPEGCDTMVMTNPTKDVVVIDTHDLEGRRMHIEFNSQDISNIFNAIIKH